MPAYKLLALVIAVFIWGRLAHYLNVHGALIILIEPNARIIVANSG